MRIKKFKGSRLHGYINVEVNFYDDITFLYGINGSGKTTIVRSINGLLSLSYRYLCEADYDFIEVLVDTYGDLKTIRSQSESDGVRLTIDGETESLTVKRFAVDPELSPLRQDDARGEWYAALPTTFLLHPVVRAIESLPTLMYLGLERRTGTVGRRYQARTVRETRSPVFSSSIQISLDDAAHHAWEAFRSVYTEESKLKDALRNDLILASFQFADVFRTFGQSASLPDRAETSKLEEQRVKVVDVLSSIGFQRDQLRTSVEPFFDALTEIIEDLPERPKSSKKRGLMLEFSEPKDREKVTRYVFNKWQYDRSNDLVIKIEEFRNKVAEIYSSIQAYRDLIDGFLSSSHKKIVIDMNGLNVEIEGVGIRPLSSLSSGEQQLVVLLTQLWFNPRAKSSNVLMIDEPEVSLHLHWQEMFVNALTQANAHLQLILATHSPSIILDRDDRAVELIPQYA